MRPFLLALLLVVVPLRAQHPDLFLHPAADLNGRWRIIVDPYENGAFNYRSVPYDSIPGVSRNAFFSDSKATDKTDLIEYDFDKSETLIVPGDWNTQDERLYYYEGTVCYRRTFDRPAGSEGKRFFLSFGGANYRADVYLNGKKLGVHTGGFTPFAFEATGLLRERNNSLVVKVDNKRSKEGVPTLSTDWWNYGGITRDVRLVIVPTDFISSHRIQCDTVGRMLSGDVVVEGPARANTVVTIEIPSLTVKKEVRTDSSGRAAFSFPVKNLVRWTPEQPMLYSIIVSTPTDRIEERIGFRTIAVKGAEILLNGKAVFLRGISMHEESPLSLGRAHSPEDALAMLLRAKELGCNFVRLAHYPHNEHIVRCADSLGLLVWEEIPVYWTFDWTNEGTYRNAEQQLTELILRDRNSASVIIWSLANETPVSDARNTFLGKLAATARSLDGTRLISAALEQRSLPDAPNIRTIADPFAETADVLSFNQYIGWYDGLPAKCREVRWQIPQNKPVIISEFGADAKAGFHADSLTRFSEEYQEYLYRETLAMLSGIPQWRGVSPWILTDFRSPRRVLPGIQDGWNRKGLFSEKGEKKKATFVLKKFYEEMGKKQTKQKK